MRNCILVIALFFSLISLSAQNQQEAERYYGMAVEAFNNKKLVKSLELFRVCDSLRIKESDYVGITANTDHWIGYILFSMGRREEAQNECLYYCQIKPEDFRRHVEMLNLEKQAQRSKKAEDYKTALMLTKRCLDIYLRDFGPEHYLVGDAYSEMADVAHFIDKEKSNTIMYYDKSLECFACMGNKGKAIRQFVAMNKSIYLLNNSLLDDSSACLPQKEDLIPQHKAYWYFIKCTQELKAGNLVQINILASEYENDADCNDDTTFREIIKQVDIYAYDSRKMYNECVDKSFALLDFLEKQHGPSSFEYMDQSIKTGAYLRVTGRVMEELLLYLKVFQAADSTFYNSLSATVDEPDIPHPMFNVSTQLIIKLISSGRTLGIDMKCDNLCHFYINILNRIEWSKRENTPDYPSLLELYAVSVKYLADKLATEGKTKESIEYYEGALAVPTIRESMWGHALMQNCAILYFQNKNYHKAIEYFEKTYQKYDSGNGTEESNLMLAYAYVNPKSSRIAELDSISFAKHQRTVISTLLSTSNEDREFQWINEYMTINEGYAIFANMCGGTNPVVNRIAYDALLLGRGFLLSTQTDMQKALSNSSDTTLSQLSKRIQALKSAAHNNIDNQQKWMDLVSEQKRLEALLVQKLTQNIQLTNTYTTTTEDIQKQLTKHSIAVEFICMADSVFSQNLSYYAFLLRNNWNAPRIVKLNIPNDFFASEDIYTNTAKTSLLWDKICEVGNVSKGDTIYFAADNAIHATNIENMRTNNGKLISDKYHIIRLSSTRELCRRSNNNERSSNAILYGGLDYTTNGEPSKSESRKNRGADIGLSPLPYTKKEVESIQNVMSRTVQQSNITCYTGQDGTENSFRTLSGHSPAILHLATHGAYLADGKSTMDRSVLYLSGSEPAFYGESVADAECDGILSAAELCDMDLTRTDLVVMSACNSALGTIASDGVFGLQRGFKIAGVKSILMTLWEVDDEATCKLMTEFYSNWIGQKMTKHDALEAAKKTVRETKGWEDPQYWAAFILLDGLD